MSEFSGSQPDNGVIKERDIDMSHAVTDRRFKCPRWRQTILTQPNRWMRIVGGFYIALGLFNTPLVIQSRLSAQYPDLGVAVDSAAAQALIDTWFMFGLEVLIIGAALLYFSRDAHRHIALAGTVLVLELVRGIVHDVYLLGRDYDPVIYGGWIMIHLVIIITGVFSVRQARRPSSPARGAAWSGEASND
ncbi:MAG: BphX family protein [Dehalococcoidia bacterium]